MKLIGQIAYSTLPNLMGVTDNDKMYEEWGKKIIEELKKQGYYINKVKGDPSGRW